MKLFTDIETVPDQRPDALERARDNVKPPAHYKKPEVIEKYRNEHAEEAHSKTALKGITGEICSIAWAIEDGDIQAVTRGVNADGEAELLTRFWDELMPVAKDMTPGGQFPRLQWIGHNIIEFDLRFIKQRSFVCGVKPGVFIPADARHGGDHVFDTMKEWAGWKGYVGLNALCDAFGIDGKGDIDGSMVGDLFAAGEYEKISEYNKQDVDITRAVYHRMTWRD